MNRVFDFLRSILPAAKMLASITPTSVDDKIVAILESLLNDPSKAAAVHAAMSEKGLI